MKHTPRRRFGQHFLTDDGVIQQIIGAIDARATDNVVEIGPGQGAITRLLAQVASPLHVVEIDRDLAADLRASDDDLVVHEADALTFDFSSLGENLRLAGNLPYNISTPLLFHLATFAERIADAHFMLQKEVVDRICAEPGNKTFGRLTVTLGCRFEPVWLFDIPPAAFSPPPKVDSSLVRLRPWPSYHFPDFDSQRLEALVRLAFSRRRKTLRNALSGLATPDDLQGAGLDPGCRPEQVPVERWIELSNGLS